MTRSHFPDTTIVREAPVPQQTLDVTDQISRVADRLAAD